MPLKRNVAKQCERCGISFLAYPSIPTRPQARYCSRTCANVVLHENRRKKFQEDIVERFWAKVEMGGVEDCWPCLHAMKDGRYGVFTADGRSYAAHRVAWELTNGPIPDGMHVLHLCDNRPCCNPRHLFLGTHQDNMRDRNEKGRQARGEKTVHPHPGEKNGRAKLTSEQVVEIRQRRSAGEYLKVLSADYGVSLGQIGHIARGDSWAIE